MGWWCMCVARPQGRGGGVFVAGCLFSFVWSGREEGEDVISVCT